MLFCSFNIGVSLQVHAPLYSCNRDISTSMYVIRERLGRFYVQRWHVPCYDSFFITPTVLQKQASG